MDKQNQYTPFKQPLPVLFRHLRQTNNSERGVSIIEMLASIAFSGLVVGVAFTGFNEYRQSFVRDQSRRSVNQSFTGVSSLIGPDILQIGQGLTDDPNFPTVRVVQTDIPGTTDKSSIITITKALVSSSLPICADISKGSSTAKIMIRDDVPDSNGKKKSGCQIPDSIPFNDDNPDLSGDGWPDILKVFRDNRLNQGGSIEAYIYAGEQTDLNNKKVHDYEIFNYTGEITENQDGTSMTPSQNNEPARAFITTDGHTWKNDYSSVGTGRIHIIERRSYFLHRKEGEDSGFLKLIIDPPQEIVDGDLSNIDDYDTLTVAENIANFEVVVNIIEDVSEDTTHKCRIIPPGDDDCFPDNLQYSWAKIQYIEMITTLAPDQKDFKRSGLTEEDLVLTERFFPRNVFSF
ncbi:hypothetical protein IQ215_05380 [Cyanobacterium stanieri LEGE 03274]|uniref:Prepilin-type N-terminal cleavage/methylation domain-containing protein n=1 Tax=Cyanobacterium stanieri LEGE 03274 TaxID=1828756 RepID=A0ABR9V2K3_9CHRO|nr:hypothetical protein [Cyanobacterium stanieri]MBE9222123.1 hypothetical protein [Cyanobacterium stanieri LEGE 03274]